MIRHLVLGLSALLIAACNDTGPVYPTSDYLDEWVTATDALDPRSNRGPAFTGERATFRLAPGEGLSMLRAGREWGVGQTYLFGFDLRAGRTALGTGRITLLRLVRLGTPETELLAVHASARHGVTVMGRSCIPPSAMANWHTVEVRYRFADNDTGFAEVFCDRRPIWARDAYRTTLPPTCRAVEGCNTPVARPSRFEWQTGLLAHGRAARPVTVEMRRIFYHRLFVIPNRVGQL